MGESAHDHALAWDEIWPTRYETSGRLDGLVPALASRHQARIAADPTFQQLLKDIEVTKQSLDQTRISLVESERRAERARQLERENRRRLAQGLKPLKQLEDAPAQEEPLMDPLLDESARIITDMIDLLGQKGRARNLVLSGD